MARHDVHGEGLVGMAEYDMTLMGLCRDMLRMHESTAIDLDEWENAKNFVGRYIYLAIDDITNEIEELKSSVANIEDKLKEVGG